MISGSANKGAWGNRTLWKLGALTHFWLDHSLKDSRAQSDLGMKDNKEGTIDKLFL